MKNTIKILFALLLVFNFSCNDDSDGRFKDTPTSGWVEFPGPTAAKTISSFTTDVRIPVSINVPQYPDGLNVSYTLQAVQGDYTPYVSTATSFYVDPINPRLPSPTIDLSFRNLDNVNDVIIFDVVLQSVDRSDVSVGVDDTSITTYRITIPCAINVSASYNASVISEGFGINEGNNGDFDYTATLTQLSPTSYTIDSAWGPSFVALLTGDPSYVGQFLYTATLTLNDDGTVTIVGTAPSRPGGTGTYNPCTNTFVLNLNQAVFTNDASVTTTLTPQ